MDKMVDVSVIMLTYNREKLVPRAIESITNQTMKNFEFIIVDNGSNDQSGDIAEKYAQKNSKIKVIHIDKSSIGRGRNVGIQCASGKYITFIDDDDTADSDMLELLYASAIRNSADITFCGYRKIDEGFTFYNEMPKGEVLLNTSEAVIELLKRKWLTAGMPTKLISRKLFQQVLFEENGKYEDISTTYKFFANAKKVVSIGEHKYCIYRHPDNNSAFTTNDKLLTPGQLREYIDAFKGRTNWLGNKIPDIISYVRYSEWSYMISMYNKIMVNELSDCYEIAKELKKVLLYNFNEFSNSPYLEDFEKIWIKKYFI